MPSPSLGGILGQAGSALTIAALAFGVIVILFTVFMLMSRRRGRSGASADLYVLEIDESRGEIIERPFTRVGTTSYVYTGPDGPRFLELTPETKVYRCVRGGKSKPCVPAYPRDVLAVPIRPELAAATHLYLDSDAMFNVAGEEDVVKMLKALYDRMGRSEKSYVVLEGPTRVLFAFNLRKMLTKLMDTFAVDGAAFFKHILTTAANVQTLERLYKALSQYAESRLKWLNYLAILIIAIAIAAAFISVFLGGQTPTPQPGAAGGVTP